MHPFHFYSTSTSAIETLEKKNYIIVGLSGSLQFAHRLNRCVCVCVVHMLVSRKKVLTKFFTQAAIVFFFLKVALH